MNDQLRRYGRLARRWWWLLLLGALIPALVANYFLVRQPNFYRAKATLIVGTSLQNPDPDMRHLSLANSLANAYARLARAGPVAQAVVEKLDLERSPGQLASQVTTRVHQDAQLLEIEVVDGDPETAALIANALAEELVARSPVSQVDQQERQQFIHSQLDELETRIEQLDEEIDALRASLVDLHSAAELEEAQRRLAELEAVRTDYQGNYAALLDSYRSETPNILTLFEPATTPTTPLPRRSGLMTAAAGVAGLGVAIAGVLLIELLDDGIRWEGETRQSLAGLPVLGAFPRLPRQQRPIPHVSDMTSHAMEMVRSLRTNILLATRHRSLHTLLFTSPGTKEGKSTAVALLGQTLAAGGKRVLLVDADLRKPSLHELFDLPNIYGLAQLLDGRERLLNSQHIPGIHHTETPNLSLLTAGKPPSDPSLLLTSSRLSQLLESLKADVDILLIDSPPERIAPDAGVLATLADATILVVRAGTTSYRKLVRVREQLEEDGVTVLGVAFNHVKSSPDAYYYRSLREPQERPGLLQRAWARIPFLGGGAVDEEGKLVLSLGGVAHKLGVSRTTVRSWCSNGRLPGQRKFGNWFVPWKEVQRFMLTYLEGKEVALEMSGEATRV
jgi:capsular exopolysaccharide synthesis family protein